MLLLFLWLDVLPLLGLYLWNVKLRGNAGYGRPTPQDFYRPFNEKLVRLLGNDDRYLWADTAAKAAAADAAAEATSGTS